MAEVTPPGDSPPGDSPLSAYRAKRDPARTPEPMPAKGPRPPREHGRAFVIQEHHARALHWDLRLEHDGVLVSWALPKGIPEDPATNHLAVHTETIRWSTEASKVTSRKASTAAGA